MVLIKLGSSAYCEQLLLYLLVCTQLTAQAATRDRINKVFNEYTATLRVNKNALSRFFLVYIFSVESFNDALLPLPHEALMLGNKKLPFDYGKVTLNDNSEQKNALTNRMHSNLKQLNMHFIEWSPFEKGSFDDLNYYAEVAFPSEILLDERLKCFYLEEYCQGVAAVSSSPLTEEVTRIRNDMVTLGHYKAIVKNFHYMMEHRSVKNEAGEMFIARRQLELIATMLPATMTIYELVDNFGKHSF